MDNKKIAVITGASRGIGESIADAFAAKGFDLILTARNAELLSHVSNRLESKHSNQVWKIPADLSTENGCTDFVRQVKELNLEIDVLVNNAGVFLPGTLMDEPVGMCSIASILAYEAGGGYAVTKHALLGFSKSLRREGIPLGIRVSAVLPGATLTDSWAGVDLPESRFMRADDVARCILTAWDINETTVMEEIIIRPIEGDI